MNLIISLIPFFVVILLLVLRKHMLVAGFAGALTAVIIGLLSIGAVTGAWLGGVGTMFSYTVPIIYAATAAMVAKAGSLHSLVELAKRGLRGNVAVLAALMVLIQGFATYTAGLGAGNTMITAPLIALAVGAAPALIASMAIVTAVAFTTSPASTESILAAEAAGVDISLYTNEMFPFTITFFVLGAIIAYIGVKRGGSLFKDKTNYENIEIESESNTDVHDTSNTPSSKLVIQSIPALTLVIAVVFGGSINSFVGITLFTPIVAVVLTTIFTILFTSLNSDRTMEALIDGSKFILTTLFGVGIFLGFINIIALTGTFSNLAALAGEAPELLIVPVAMLVAFVVAVPAGAFAAGVLTLILPTLSQLGLSPLAMGFVAISTGLGTQISPVQINVAALSRGFKIKINDIIRMNYKYVLIAFVLLITIAVVFV